MLAGDVTSIRQHCIIISDSCQWSDQQNVVRGMKLKYFFVCTLYLLELELFFCLYNRGILICKPYCPMVLCCLLLLCLHSLQSIISYPCHFYSICIGTSFCDISEDLTFRELSLSFNRKGTLSTWFLTRIVYFLHEPPTPRFYWCLRLTHDMWRQLHFSIRQHRIIISDRVMSHFFFCFTVACVYFIVQWFRAVSCVYTYVYCNLSAPILLVLQDF